MIKTPCKIAGIVLVVVGVVGFFMPTMLGMHLTVIHDVVHILSGAVAAFVGFRSSVGAARKFGWIFGGIYLLLGILGFVAPSLVGTILGHPGPLTASDLLPDNVVHLLVGGAFLVLASIGKDR